MALPNSATSFSDLSKANIGVSSPQTDNTTNYNVGLLINQNNVAEGPTIPPIQNGQYRIPRPNAFGVASIASAKPMGSLIVFTWQDIESFGSEIGEYRILANFAYDNNATPVEVGSSQNSPCTVQVLAPTATAAVFFLRPYLTNGQTLPLEQCPSCTVDIPGPVFQLTEGSDIIYIDSNRPSSGGSGTTTIDTYDSTTTWTAPANVTSVTVECWGPGGDGGEGWPTGVGGGGGGGGGYGTGTATVTPGTTYNVFAPGGGSGLSSYFSAAPAIAGNGGANGQIASGSGVAGTGGTGGAGSTANGTNGVDTATATGGNGGAAAGGGGAGGAGSGTTVGTNGTAPGGGGGGGAWFGGTSYVGGSGANGRVRLTYTTTAGGSNAPGIGIVNSSGQLSSLTDGSLIFINTSGKVTTSLGTASGAGFITVADGTAANDLTLIPGNATTATGGAQTLPGNPTGFIKIKVGGTEMRVPYYSV